MSMSDTLRRAIAANPGLGLDALVPHIGSKIRLTQSVWDHGADHHPPGWLATVGEVVEVRHICETPGALAVAHAGVTDSAFVVYEGEYEVLFADDDDLGAPDDNASAQAAGGIASCIGCGCDDRHACDGGCWWLEVDYAAGFGVCSQCDDHVDAWRRGDRTPHAPSAREEEAEAVRDLGRELRFEQPRPPGWRPDTCTHDWPYPQPEWGDACRWCGMSFARYVHTQCP